MFQQPPAVKVLSVPELLEFIHSYLAVSDLVSCSTVSKAFNVIFTPALWHAISLRTQAQHRRFTETPEVQAALSRNGKYIRAIRIETCKSLAPFLNVNADHFKNISTLQFLCSIESDSERETTHNNDSVYGDEAHGLENLESDTILHTKITDWLQERDVFLINYYDQKPMHWDYDQDQDQKLLHHFLAHVPGIKSFSGGRLLESHSQVTKAVINKLTTSGLQSLSLVFCYPISVARSELLENLGALLDNCPPQVEALRVSAIKQLLIEGDLAFHIRPRFLVQCPKLRSLSLGVSSDKTLKIASRYISEHCPLLEELAVAFADVDIDLIDLDITSNSFVDLLESCSNLEAQSSHFSHTSLPDQEPESHKTKTLTGRVGLKKLMLCGIPLSRQGDPLIEALYRYHSSTLTHLALKCWTASNTLLSVKEDMPIRKITKSLRRLEHMEFLLPGNMVPRWTRYSHVNAVVLADIGMTWQFANTLRVLRVMIDGIHRLSAFIGATASQDTSSLEPSSDVETQVKVCEILGSLVNLEELALGIDKDDGPSASIYTNWGYQTSCLELTLETGLCSMSELKRLQIFKVTRMDHNIGLNEVQWMCETWPDLKQIRGLEKHQLGAPYVRDLDKLLTVRNETLDWVKEHHPHIRCT
ncbi:hypothetical protein BGX26_008733 [Mortierella sp. AD094]|nr:hypothetical protein BGX26_008733 [Mortierella sp. AD094]